MEWARVDLVEKNHFCTSIDEADAVAVDSCFYPELEVLDVVKYNGGDKFLLISLYLSMVMAIRHAAMDCLR